MKETLRKSSKTLSPSISRTSKNRRELQSFRCANWKTTSKWRRKDSRREFSKKGRSPSTMRIISQSKWRASFLRKSNSWPNRTTNWMPKSRNSKKVLSKLKTNTKWSSLVKMNKSKTRKESSKISSSRWRRSTTRQPNNSTKLRRSTRKIELPLWKRSRHWTSRFLRSRKRSSSSPRRRKHLRTPSPRRSPRSRA